MPWVAIVQDSAQLGDRQETAVLLTDGVSQKYIKRFVNDGSLADLTSQCNAEIARADSFATKKQKAEFGPGTTIPLSLPGPVDTTPVTPSASQAWRTLRSQWLQRRALISEGWIPANDATFDAMTKTLASTFVDAPAFTSV